MFKMDVDNQSLTDHISERISIVDKLNENSNNNNENCFPRLTISQFFILENFVSIYYTIRSHSMARNV